VTPPLILSSPQPLRPDHELDRFDSGEPVLDDWLRKRALTNEAEGASRTYVVCESGVTRVVAYYCLATGAVQRSDAPGAVRRNMPEPIPVMVLGRLAVDRSFQKKGLGRALLRDAILRTLRAADIAGIRALLVHALSEPARVLYTQSGFQPSPIDAATLMLRLSEARQIVATSQPGI
jgi:GNAT superfamily N-acetyltransferase